MFHPFFNYVDSKTNLCTYMFNVKFQTLFSVVFSRDRQQSSLDLGNYQQ